ncbi:hypothetical protein PPL_09948 [Heterostelium album PN500]|uniref:t-SNARE coiled-coil homology domain-containing protein n=1 Tax=Heterostelium pallidum (strain ATCC 26659 / Pp 5 / PN500) TaxID=670386 RepID=D3BPM3_HETP5|nr:hypothetical protein PPL_09948 [Heterostelium album PN500]EFA76643.1 hypothetical protein PPL_09948 [Heterostelium album PN500]|eukprot:XP_020428775.1 hypothetical protein PPL_09948 [Heterostelium album PN500]
MSTILLGEYEQDFLKVVELEKGIKDIKSAAAKKKKNILDIRQNAEHLDERLKVARNCIVFNNLKSFRREYRILEKKEQTEYETKAKQYDETLRKLENELRWAEKQNEGDPTNTGEIAIPINDQAQNQYNQDMAQAKRLQQQDKEAITRMEAQGVEMVEIGINTLSGMEHQNQQLKKIDENLNQVEDNLKLATRQMRAFARKMATDKLIMGLILLIVLAVSTLSTNYEQKLVSIKKNKMILLELVSFIGDDVADFEDNDGISIMNPKNNIDVLEEEEPTISSLAISMYLMVVVFVGVVVLDSKS